MPSDTNARASQTGIRLSFAYDAKGLRLFDRTVVHKPVSSKNMPLEEIPPGTIAVELRGPAGEPRSYTLVPDAMPTTIEVFGPGPGDIRHAPSAKPAGVFIVDVPDDIEAQDVVVLAGTPVPGPIGTTRAFHDAAARGMTTVLGTFPLRAGGDVA